MQLQHNIFVKKSYCNMIFGAKLQLYFDLRK